MDVVSWVLAHAGIAHRRDLQSAGFTAYRIGIALRSGHLKTIRRHWVVHPSADALVVLAATIGGRVACVSAARILGLWTLSVDRPHLWVPPNSVATATAAHRIHRSVPIASVRRTSLVESISDVLDRVATCRPHEESLAIWESALKQRLILPSAVAGIRWRSLAAQRLARAASLLSDSGLESLVLARLREMDLVVRQQVFLLGHRVDLLVGKRLVIQIDGWEHHSSAADRARDNRHDARLRAAGYRVIRIGYAEVVHGWAAIEAEIVLAVAQGAHLAASTRSF